MHSNTYVPAFHYIHGSGRRYEYLLTCFLDTPCIAPFEQFCVGGRSPTLQSAEADFALQLPCRGNVDRSSLLTIRFIRFDHQVFSKMCAFTFKPLRKKGFSWLPVLQYLEGEVLEGSSAIGEGLAPSPVGI